MFDFFPPFFDQLSAKSTAIASLLLTQWKVTPGSRVLLLYPPGLEFVVAFIACLRASKPHCDIYPAAMFVCPTRSMFPLIVISVHFLRMNDNHSDTLSRGGGGRVSSLPR